MFFANVISLLAKDSARYPQRSNCHLLFRARSSSSGRETASKGLFFFMSSFETYLLRLNPAIADPLDLFSIGRESISSGSQSGILKCDVRGGG